MNKKGFTLIELVGVIVLLGIMAVITVPIVRNITKDAKQKGYEKQINVVLESSKNWAIQNTDLLPENNTSILVKMDTLKKDGFLENRKIINPVNNEEMNGCAKITYNTDFNQYEYEYNAECFLQNEIIISEHECLQKDSICPVNTEDGTMLTIQVNGEQTEDFYVMADDGNKLTLILNRNLGDDVAWYEYDLDNSYGPITALAYLQEQTDGWTNLPKMTISTFDYADNRGDVVLGNNKSFTMYARLPRYYEPNDITTNNGGVMPRWLYINLNGTGDSVADSNGKYKFGYWTSTASSVISYYAYSVVIDGFVGPTDVYYNGSLYSNCGVRPVIEISKFAPAY